MFSVNGPQSTDIPVKQLEKADKMVRKARVNSQVQSLLGQVRGGIFKRNDLGFCVMRHWRNFFHGS